ncbi:hypothetical protein [Flavobacterium sp. FPG59]|uniref:hypothetical protein n=1 Tax=Flavobacterium sp. FPG59 TaxID=1929267 RepID=UPI000A395F9F|nr:hypothetical protein [Flavobacterium sp. FPG59]OUD36946.1 hypothetical protein FPG59_03740 [Flavobacterium sp. FPG59]
MKKLLMLISAIIIISGCEPGSVIDYDYTIVNDSGKTVILIPFLNGEKDFKNAITLNQGEKINKKYRYTPPGGAGYSMVNLLKSDYIAFVYNTEKINIFSIYSEQCTTCPSISNNAISIKYTENNRNPFNSKFNDEETEVYTITAEDYQNAQDCGGNCN